MLCLAHNMALNSSFSKNTFCQKSLLKALTHPEQHKFSMHPIATHHEQDKLSMHPCASHSILKLIEVVKNVTNKN